MRDRDFGLWGETAEPAPDVSPLPGDRSTEVAIVGAGFTGLSTALHLAERGIGSLVIDAEHPGFGASGRNGGQVLPGFKTYPDHLVRRYGAVRGEAMIRFGARIADDLFGLVARHAIRCDALRSGWIHAGHHESMLAEQRWKHDQWASRGEPVRWLDRAAMAEHLGTEAYVGGWIDERGGSVQPLSLARGLALAASGLGAGVFAPTRALRLGREADGYRVTTACGTIRARHVVVATNGYSGRLVPRLPASLVAVESAQVATEPLAPDLLRRVLPTGSPVSDTRRSLLYFRRSPDGRFVMGGRGGILLPTGEDLYDRLRRATVALYPQLAAMRFTHSWSGKLAVTLDHMPHLHEPEPGLIASVGCNGRGVAYATAMGRVIADRIARETWAGLPMPVSPVAPMPL